jgi:hypothetical protein
LPVAKVAVDEVSDIGQKVKNFCLIQLQLLTEKEKGLRKQILDCKMQREFLSSLLVDIEESDD